MTRDELYQVKKLTAEIRVLCESNTTGNNFDIGNGDILRSVIILENKVNYYLKNYEALDSHNLINSDTGEV